MSLESPVDDSVATLERFNKQFALEEPITVSLVRGGLLGR